MGVASIPGVRLDAADPSPAERLPDPANPDEFLEALLARLGAAGAPQGTWLLDIEITRRALREAHAATDELLGRLEDALVEGMRQKG